MFVNYRYMTESAAQMEKRNGPTIEPKGYTADILYQMINRS